MERKTPPGLDASTESEHLLRIQKVNHWKNYTSERIGLSDRTPDNRKSRNLPTVNTSIIQQSLNILKDHFQDEADSDHKSGKCITLMTRRNETSRGRQSATKDALGSENVEDSTPDSDQAGNKIRNKPIVMTQLINS